MKWLDLRWANYVGNAAPYVICDSTRPGFFEAEVDYLYSSNHRKWPPIDDVITRGVSCITTRALAWGSLPGQHWAPADEAVDTDSARAFLMLSTIDEDKALEYLSGVEKVKLP